MKTKPIIEFINKNHSELFNWFALQKILETLHKKYTGKTVPIIIYSNAMSKKEIETIFIRSIYYKYYSLDLVKYLFITDDIDKYFNYITNSIECLNTNKIDDIVVLFDTRNYDIDLIMGTTVGLYTYSNFININIIRGLKFVDLNKNMISYEFFEDNISKEITLCRTYTSINDLNRKKSIITTKNIYAKNKIFYILDDSIVFSNNYKNLIENCRKYLNSNEYIQYLCLECFLNDVDRLCLYMNPNGSITKNRSYNNTNKNNIRKYKGLNEELECKKVIIKPTFKFDTNDE